jgi:hypothetical protein
VRDEIFLPDPKTVSGRASGLINNDCRRAPFPGGVVVGRPRKYGRSPPPRYAQLHVKIQMAIPEQELDLASRSVS